MSYLAKLGWDKGLKPRYQFKLFELRSAVSRYVPSKSGRLRREVNKSSNWKVSGTTDNPEVTMSIDPPYAQIQDEGGTSPAVFGKAMRMPWGWRMSRVSSAIPGFNYTEQGIQDFLASRGAIEVGWA